MRDGRSMQRFADTLVRHRVALLTAWLVHAFLLHVFVLGYMTGDGLSYRVTPIIELAQHGTLGTWKYQTDWTLQGHVPFVELFHLPFLVLFGLLGLLVGFPLVLFPLCAAAMFKLVLELSQDQRAATFGALAFVAMPMHNAQAFAGLVDFAVAGALAYWLYALLRVCSDEPVRRALARFTLATVCLTVARQHGLYLAVLLFPLAAYAVLAGGGGGSRAVSGQRDGVSMHRRRAIPLAVAGLALGSLPAVVLQIYRAVEFGSPIAPSELRVFGIQLAHGIPLEHHLIANGIPGDDLPSLASGFVHGWIGALEWPIGAFHHSQYFGAGFITLLALALIPVFVRHATRTERRLVVALVVISALARDFALPRWAYGLTIVLVILVARSMATLVATPLVGRHRRVLYWVGCAILVAQLARPELDLAQVRAGHWISPRLNVAGSPWFLHGPGEIKGLPDRDYQIVIIERTYTGYTVPLFGRRLTNDVIGTLTASELGPRCEGARTVLQRQPRAVFVDELGLTAQCERTCVQERAKRCKLFALHPP